MNPTAIYRIATPLKDLPNKIYRLARNVMLQKKKKLIKKLTGLQKGTVLDIGSGTGYFAGTMKKAGWNARGIEINAKARQFSIEHFGLDITTPENISDLETGGFDCITLWHVLEHFHHPFNYFSEIHRLLKPGGVCVIALPNCSSYDAEHYKEFWAAWDVPRHLWHFKLSTFRIFSEKNQFFLSGNARALPLDVFYISQLSEKYKGSSLPFLKGISVAIVFAFLSLFTKERSSSLIYVLRKSMV